MMTELIQFPYKAKILGNPTLWGPVSFRQQRSLSNLIVMDKLWIGRNVCHQLQIDIGWKQCGSA